MLLLQAVGEPTLRASIAGSGPPFDADPRYRQVFDAVRALHQPGFYLDGWQGSPWPAAERQWLQGASTHMINASWMLRATASYHPDPEVIRMAAFPVPTMPGALPGVFAEITGHPLLRGGKNKRGPVELLRSWWRRRPFPDFCRWTTSCTSSRSARFGGIAEALVEVLTSVLMAPTTAVACLAPRSPTLACKLALSIAVSKAWDRWIPTMTSSSKRSTRLCVVCALASLLVFGCKRERTQTYAQGIAAFCDAARGLEVTPPEQRASAMARNISATVSNPEALSFVSSLPRGSPEETDAAIRRAQKSAGLTSCYFLDADPERASRAGLIRDR